MTIVRHLAHADRAFYRSQIVRLAFLVTGGFLSYALSPLAPYGLHNSPALLLIHRLLPWWCMSAPFMVYTLLLVWGTVAASIAADTIGMALYSVFLAALIVSTIDGQPVRIGHAVGVQHVWSPVVLSAFALVVVMHFAALRLAVIDWTRTQAGLR